MMGLLGHPILALEGEWGDIRAVLVVIVAFVVLIGSIYMLLWSNLGARLGYLVLMVSLGAFMILLSLTWVAGLPGTVPGLGPRGEEPHWVAFLPESPQGAEFRDDLDGFPSRWDPVGEQYPGKIDSSGEFDTVRTVVADAMARLEASEGQPADEAEDWLFRLEGSEAITEEDRQTPEATARFFQADADTLLFGVTIPATEAGPGRQGHREVTVFALRDKGKVFLYALYFLVASIALFALHLWLLMRFERKRPLYEGAEAPAA